MGIGESDELLSLLQPEPREALKDWMATTGRVLGYADWVASGNTSAQLLGAYVEDEEENSTQGVVIKILPPRPKVSREEISHREALRHSKDYAAAHLLKIKYDPIRLPNNGWITFQEVAGGGFDELTTLGELIRADPEGIDRLAIRCGAIVRSVLSDWAAARNPVKVQVREFLRGLLSNRLDEGGTVTAWAARHPGLVNSPRPCVILGDTELVNPFAMALDPAVSKDVSVRKITGKVHGDLHPDNILVRKVPDADPGEYWLVDLSRYSSDGAVVWDPTYLATTITAMLLPRFSSYERRELRSLLIDPGRSSNQAKLGGLHACLKAIDDAARGFAKEQSLMAPWRRQAPLCLLAACLVMSGRSIISSKNREWFFWVAAYAATEFARIARLGDSTDCLHLPSPLIDPTPADTPDQDPHSSGLDAAPSDTDGGEAVILQFPTGSAASAAVDTTAPEQSTSTIQMPWEALVLELQRTVFDPTDWLTLAASTEALRIELARGRQPHASSDREIARLLTDLEGTLMGVLRPSATQIQVRSACETAERLRVWLLDLLT